MSDFSAPLLLVGAFAILLLTLALLSRQISINIQLLVYYLTRSTTTPTVAIFLIFLPGVVIHEAAHWCMARLLGLKTGKFRVWPKRHGKHIGLGSVSVQSRGPFWDSLVGVAPLLVGSILIGLIGNAIFNTYTVGSTLAQGQLGAALQAFWAAFDNPDGYLWAYLLFAIANAMMPSASDREPLKPVLLYAGVASVIYILLGMPLQGVQALMLRLTPALQAVTSSLLFTVLLDCAILAVLALLRLLVARQ